MQTGPSQLSWKDVDEFAKTMSPDQISAKVLEQYKNVGVQQHGSLMLFTVNNPSTVVDCARGTETYAEANRLAKREMKTASKVVSDTLIDQTVSNLAGSSFVYCTSEKGVKHRFLKSARALDNSEIAHIKITDQDNGKEESGSPKLIKMEAVPYGLLFQAMYIEGTWILASPNNCCLNDVSFGSSTTVLKKFEEMLLARDFSLQSLKQNAVYTFVLGCNEFSAFPLKKEYLILRSIFSKAEQTEPDSLLKLRDPALKPFLVNVENKSFTLIQNILRSRRQSQFYKLLEADIPINYFLVKYDKIFQYSTPLFERLWKYYLHCNTTQSQTTLQDYMKNTFKTEYPLVEYLLKATRPKIQTNPRPQKTTAKKYQKDTK